MTACSISGCREPVSCKDLCKSHYGKQWRAANADRARANNARWYAANKEKAKATAKAYAAANPERWAEYCRRWRLANPEKHNERWRRRRDRLAQAPISDFTKDQWQEVLAEFGHRCVYCLTTVNLSREHLTPISRGGSNTKNNVVPACRSCNAKKCDRTLLEFLLYRLAS